MSLRVRGLVLNRMEVSSDGKTPYERIKGKKAPMLGLEFGGKIMWKCPPKNGKLEKLNPRWDYGMYLGVRVKSGELIVVDAETFHCKCVRTARRVPEEERWNDKNLDLVKVVPWNMGRTTAKLTEISRRWR